MTEQSAADRLQKYIDGLQALDQRRSNLNLVMRWVLILLSLSLLTFTFISAPPIGSVSYGFYYVYYVPRVSIAFIVLLLAFIFPRAPSNDATIRSAANELELLTIDEASLEARAEKLFRNHQYELEKYYDQTLRHSSYIFSTGILCIVAGFGLIGITFVLIYTTGDVSEKIISAVVGSIGTLAVSFIGAIYLRMYSQTMKSLTDFHQRLVLTHHLHFANFLNAKIDDKNLRESTLASLAQSLVAADRATTAKPTSQEDR